MSQTHKKIAVGFIVIALLGLLWMFGRPKRAEAITNKREYAAGSSLDVGIQSNLGKAICFSSCYPYLLQKEEDGNGNWQNYTNAECLSSDVVSTCVPDKGFKEFRLSLDSVETGAHRMMIPICLDCQIGQGFRQDEILYSNIFQVR